MGRYKLISVEQMATLFDEYKEYVKQNPYVVVDYVGKEAVPVNRYKQRPITMEGFEVFVSYKPDMPWDLDHYFSNKDNSYGDYVSICSRIRREIRDEQIGGGMAGVYNPSITQRLNGLVDKQEVKTIKEQPLFADEPEEPETGGPDNMDDLLD